MSETGKKQDESAKQFIEELRKASPKQQARLFGQEALKSLKRAAKQAKENAEPKRKGEE